MNLAGCVVGSSPLHTLGAAPGHRLDPPVRPRDQLSCVWHVFSVRQTSVWEPQPGNTRMRVWFPSWPPALNSFSWKEEQHFLSHDILRVKMSPGGTSHCHLLKGKWCILRVKHRLFYKNNSGLLNFRKSIVISLTLQLLRHMGFENWFIYFFN